MLVDLCKIEEVITQYEHPLFLLFCTKKLFFLFYTPIFIKHLSQFIYSTHLFNKIFILLQFFIILSLTAFLSQTQSETHLSLQLIKLTNTTTFIDFGKAKSHLAKDIPQFSYWVFFLSQNFASSSVNNQN